MTHKRNTLLFILLSGFTFGFGQLSYNTTLLGNWSNDSLPVLGTLGQRFNELWGYADTIKNKEYIIMGSTDSTYFFDVTNPSSIKLCDVEAGRSRECVNRDFQTYSHYAYAVNDQNAGSLQVFDLQYLPDSVHKVYDSDTLGKTTHTICIYGDKMYMCSNTSRGGQRHAMRIASLARPDSPAFVALFDAPVVGGNKLFDNIHDMIIVDDTAYLSCGNDGLFMFDISDPMNLKYVYSISSYPEKGYNHNAWITRDKKHIVFTDENLGLGVKLFEIQSPTSYKLKSIFRSHVGALAHNPFIIGNTRVYLSYYQDGVYLFDISDDSNPKVIAYYDTYPENTGFTGFQGCWGVYPYMPSGNIFASDMSHGLFALKMEGTGINGGKVTGDLLLYPNPARYTTTMNLISSSDQGGSLEVIDATGKQVRSEAIALLMGKNALDITTGDLPRGIYFIRVTTADATYSARLLKH
jgi:choice-of-anchor B domain-containing protein